VEQLLDGFVSDHPDCAIRLGLNRKQRYAIKYRLTLSNHLPFFQHVHLQRRFGVKLTNNIADSCAGEIYVFILHVELPHYGHLGLEKADLDSVDEVVDYFGIPLEKVDILQNGPVLEHEDFEFDAGKDLVEELLHHLLRLQRGLVSDDLVSYLLLDVFGQVQVDHGRVHGSQFRLEVLFSTAHAL